MEKKPIKFYIMKYVKVPEIDDISLLIHITLPYSWYQTKPTDEVCELLTQAFKDSGYFESAYNLPIFQSDPPKEWKECPIEYFDSFKCFDIPFINDKNEFIDPFNLNLANGIYSNSEDDFELIFNVVMPLKKYKDVSVENICENLSKSFKLCITSEKTLEEIPQRYELHLFGRNIKHKNNG